MTTRLQNAVILFGATLLAVTAAVAQTTEISISPAVAIKAATSKVQPDYPSMGRQLRLEGTVEVEAHITEEGKVSSVKGITGNAVLMNAAVEAMKRWKFTPFLDGGKPVKAVTPMTFTFKL